jgi:ubiquitin-like protein Pup
VSQTAGRIEPPTGEEPEMPQEQEKKKVPRRSGGGGADEDAGEVRAASKGEKLKEEMDDILEQIDSVLEENAEEFVKSYVQKGGQ